MLVTRLRIIICAVVFIIGVFFLWNNILILDDFHHTYGENSQVETEPQQNQPETTKESTPAPVSPAPGTAVSPNTQPVKKGHHIHINLDEKQLYVYKDGQLVRTYPCSGGKSSTPTPLGTWRIISKDTWGEGFGGAWLGFNVPWGKYGIHGTVYPWLIGKSNASKGCIRMLNKDVRELYKIVPHGTTVTITHSNPVFRALKSGDVGSDVKEVQKALNTLGYYRGGADGRFGSGLKSVVIKFQRDHKLRANGIIDRKTYNLIMENAKAAGR